MTHDELIATGFKHFPSNITILRQWDDMYQLRVRDEHGTRYFLNVYRWHVGWEAEIVSNGAAWRGGTMWLKTSCSNKTADDVIRWGEELWERLALNYYERDE